VSSPAAPSTPTTTPPRDAVVERFAESCASYWTRDGITMLVLRGVLDRRIEDCIGSVTRRARCARLPLVVDLSAVARISVDILALLLDAHADPGLTFVPPLPPAFLALTEMTGTSSVFALLPADTDHRTQ
jgi:anti-anti-sigma regulatory factor